MVFVHKHLLDPEGVVGAFGSYPRHCVKTATLKKTENLFSRTISLNAGQKHCRMHSAILSTFIKLPFVIKIFDLSIFEWRFYTGFTVHVNFQTGDHLFHLQWLPKEKHMPIIILGPTIDCKTII